MKILLIDDYAQDMELLLKAALDLEGQEHQIDIAETGDEGLRMYSKHGPYDLVLTDIQHEGPNGFEIAEEIHIHNPKQRVAFFTAYPILTKPFTIKEASDFLKHLL